MPSSESRAVQRDNAAGRATVRGINAASKTASLGYALNARGLDLFGAERRDDAAHVFVAGE